MIGKTVKTSKAVLIQEGLVDLDSIYSNLRKWFDSKKYDFYENEHITKEDTRGKNIKYIWTGERKATEYIQYIVKVTFIMKEVLREKGKFSGKLNLKIESKMELDYGEKWQDTGSKNFLFKIYNNFIKKQEILDYKKKLETETNQLVKIAKQDLNLET